MDIRLLVKIKLARRAILDKNYPVAYNILYLNEDEERLIKTLDVKNIDLDYVSTLSDKEFNKFVGKELHA